MGVLCLRSSAMPTRGIKPFATPQDVLEYENRAEQEAGQLALNQLADVSSMSDIITRQAIANEDLNSNTETATNGLVDVSSPAWVTTENEAAGWHGWYSVEDGGNAEDKGVVVWGLEFLDEDEASALPFSTLRVKNSTGGLLDIIDIESVDISDNGRLLFDNPVMSSTQDVYFEIYQTSAPGAGSESDFKVKPLVTVGEEVGDTLEGSGNFIKG